MTNPALDTLRAVRVLQGVNEEDLQLLSSIAHEEDHPAGTVLFNAGEPGNRFYLVVEGAVSLELTFSGANKRIQTVDEGELVGWSPLLGHPMKATARTQKQSKLISFDAKETLELCGRRSEFGFALMREIARALEDRLNATRLHLLEACHHQLPNALPIGVHEGAD